MGRESSPRSRVANPFTGGQKDSFGQSFGSRRSGQRPNFGEEETDAGAAANTVMSMERAIALQAHFMEASGLGAVIQRQTEGEEEELQRQPEEEETLSPKLNVAQLQRQYDEQQQAMLQRQPEEEEETLSPKLNVAQLQRQYDEQQQAMLQRQPEEEEELRTRLSVQPKLTIGQPGDKYEQEADRTAAKVMAMPDSIVQAFGGSGVQEFGDSEVSKQGEPQFQRRINVTASIQRNPTEDEELAQPKLHNSITPQLHNSITPQLHNPITPQLHNSPTLQAKGQAPTAPENFETQLAQHKGSGQPLSDEARSFMEPRFGTDFSNVRVHETPDLANSIQAQAFTHGQDIYFNSGKYNPGSSGGKELLAHELTHVVQQKEAATVISLQREVKSQANAPVDRVIILCDKWNVREQPSRSASKLGTLKYGEKVPLKGKKTENWLEIEYLGKTGFIYKKSWIKIQRNDDPQTDPAALGYVGLNPEAHKEADALESSSKDTVNISLDEPTEHENYDALDKQEKFVVSQLGVTPKHPKFQTILNCIEKCDPGFREQMADLLMMFRSAELGKYSLERLVFSGHHYDEGDSHAAQNGVDTLAVWGEEFSSGQMKSSKDLKNLVTAFPKAAAQVKDIMFSACNSTKQVDLCKQFFPNLKTVWAYKGSSPSVKQGSSRHVERWNSRTEGDNMPTKRDRKGKIAIWIKGRGFI